MYDEFNSSLARFVIDKKNEDSFKTLKTEIDKLYSRGYKSLKIEISGDSKIAAGNNGLDISLFNKICEKQSLPPAVVFDLMMIKSSLNNKEIFERLDFEW